MAKNLPKTLGPMGAVEYLEHLQAKVNAGEPGSVLTALAHCFVAGLQVPDCLQDAYLVQYSQVEAGSADTLDSAFGFPVAFTRKARDWRKKRNALRGVLVEFQRNYPLASVSSHMEHIAHKAGTNEKDARRMIMELESLTGKPAFERSRRGNAERAQYEANLKDLRTSGATPEMIRWFEDRYGRTPNEKGVSWKK